MAIKDFKPEIFRIFDNQWALVTAGTKDNFNTMTISWGQLGSLWGNANQARNICTVFVKPARYTHEYMENNEYFTVAFFDESKKPILGTLGSKSGRDMDKIHNSGLTPEFLEHGITFKEATKTIVVRKMYSHDLDKTKIPSEFVDMFYATDDLDGKPHTMYIGEVVDIIEK